MRALFQHNTNKLSSLTQSEVEFNIKFVYSNFTPDEKKEKKFSEAVLNKNIALKKKLFFSFALGVFEEILFELPMM